VNITEVKASSTGAEIFIQSLEIGDLPIIQYILKYDQQNAKQSQFQTLIVPGNFSRSKVNRSDGLIL
jgi:hypothetical protein